MICSFVGVGVSEIGYAVPENNVILEKTDNKMNTIIQ